MPEDDIMWLAQRHGQDWHDEDLLAAVRWLTSLLPKADWCRRVEETAARYHAAKGEWARERRIPLFDPADQIAWYLFQARCYGDPDFRPDFFEPEGYRIAPLFRRIGQLLPELTAITGAEERAARLMTDGKSRPDDGIYELLVAGTYKRRGWDRVAFVQETPDAKQPDLFVSRGPSHWAVECKRAGRSGYAQDERRAGEAMATRAHERSRALRRPIIVMVRFKAELINLPNDYLSQKVDRFAGRSQPYRWSDDISLGVVGDVDGRALQQVLLHDDIYFGSSRMFQLLVGHYEPSIDFTVSGDWAPAEGRPLHATSVGHVSLVAWRSQSAEAGRRKAQHFRGVVGRASEQLPGDRPGVIHVGYEAVGGNSVDDLRHSLNHEQMKTFVARDSQLQWVYGNYFMPEHVTARNESAAVSETTAWYPVGRPTSSEPLPGHMLFMDEDGQPGTHFAGKRATRGTS